MAELLPYSVSQYCTGVAFAVYRTTECYSDEHDHVYLNFDVSGDHFMLPYYCLSVRGAWAKRNNIALSIIKDTRTTYTTARVLKYFLNNDISGVIYKISLKEDTYYLSKGLLLDKDKNVLMAVCYDCTLKEGATESYFVNYPILLVSPQVIINTEDTLCKYIIRKFVPYMLQHTETYFDVPTLDHFEPCRESGYRKDIKVVFDYFPIVFHPQCSKKVDYTEVKRILQENIDSIHC